jgi:EAL and modified HD-GYP domain-containing signal transduction protein
MIEPKHSEDDLMVSIARRPIFDNRGHLWGYELFCVGRTESGYSEASGQADAATSVASSAYLCLQKILQGGKKMIVDFSEKNILENLPYVLPPLSSAIKISENIARQPTGMEILNRLKLDGYAIAIRSFTDNPECESLYSMASILALETRGEDGKDLNSNVERAAKYGAMLLASEVEDRRLYEVCKGLNFSLFCGPYFKYPDRVTVRKLTSNEILRFQLLKFLETEDPEAKKIAEGIQRDATISFRLLGFLNSAAFAFTQRIKSIQQAVSLLGWYNIKNWLRVILMTDMTQSKEAEELVILSAQRGMFLEGVAREHDYWGFDPGSLHLLGLFSLMDTMLALPMTEIVSHLPIENKLKSALCHDPNSEYAPLLKLTQCFEDARWSDVEAMIQQLNLDKEKVMEAFQKSVDWSSSLESLRPDRS